MNVATSTSSQVRASWLRQALSTMGAYVLQVSRGQAPGYTQRPTSDHGSDSRYAGWEGSPVPRSTSSVAPVPGANRQGDVHAGRGHRYHAYCLAAVWAAVTIVTAVPASAQTITYLNADVLTQGLWKGHYGLLGFNLYPEGGMNDPVTWVKGGGTQYRANGVHFDPSLPQRNGLTNCCDPVTYTDTRPGHVSTGVVPTGGLWPEDARLWTGFYHREDVPGQKMRIGLSVSAPCIISIYLVDWDRWGRVERVSFFADSGIPVTEPGSLGQATQNGPLLNTQVITDFEGGKYIRYSASGPGKFIVQFEAVGTTPDDAANVAVESGIFIDPLPTSLKLSRPTNVHIVN